MANSAREEWPWWRRLYQRARWRLAEVWVHGWGRPAEEPFWDLSAALRIYWMWRDLREREIAFLGGFGDWRDTWRSSSSR